MKRIRLLILVLILVLLTTTSIACGKPRSGSATDTPKGTGTVPGSNFIFDPDIADASPDEIVYFSVRDFVAPIVSFSFDGATGCQSYSDPSLASGMLDPVSGEGWFKTGPISPAIDRLVATDSAGETAYFTINVSGTGGGTGGGTGTPGVYGTYVDGTDKWHIDFHEDDFLAALTVASGVSPADAEEVKRLVIQYLEGFYSDLPISFSTEPPENGEAPAQGDRERATDLSNPYNVIAIYESGVNDVMARAFQDGSDYTGTNRYIENNTGWTGSSYVGVYIHVYAGNIWISGVDPFAYFLAVFVGHEIGHSLGLEHDYDYNDYHLHGHIDYNVWPSKPYGLKPADRAFLESTLPGPGRN